MKRTFRICCILFALLLFVGSFSYTVGAETLFTDVTSDTPHIDAIYECAEKGYMVGVSHNRFAPNGAVTRAEAIAVLYRIAGVQENNTEASVFSDVPKDAWYAPYVNWAYRKQITYGCGGGIFAANSILTGEQLAAMIYRFASLYDIKSPSSDSLYDDEEEASPFAEEGIAFCLSLKIMTTKEQNLFKPKSEVTRGELSEILLSLYDVCFAGKTVEVYLIAGQSNAAGNTYWNVDNTEIQNYVQNSPAKDGFDNVLYFGSGSIQTACELTTVRFGLGANSTMLGPEVGMAEVFSEYYGEQKNRDVCIVKYALGASGLINTQTSTPNWYPPTLQAELGKAEIYSTTGVLYKNLMTVLKDAVKILKDAGYDKVTLKGFYWMQGEADVLSLRLYKKVFPVFMSDLRKDAGDIFGEDLSEMPILVGEISETYAGGNNGKNATFIAGQNALTEALTEGYIVKNGSIPTGGLGGDSGHWGFFDVISIGKNVGNMFVKIDKGELSRQKQPE